MFFLRSHCILVAYIYKVTEATYSKVCAWCSWIWRSTRACLILPLFKGYGGGFNERENVEYIEREESDGEYDEVSWGTCITVERQRVCWGCVCLHLCSWGGEMLVRNTLWSISAKCSSVKVLNWNQVHLCCLLGATKWESVQVKLLQAVFVNMLKELVSGQCMLFSDTFNVIFINTNVTIALC